MDRIQVFELFSKNLQRKRNIRVILPKDYDRLEAESYSVLYMHDGQNLLDKSPFSGFSWDVLNTMDTLYPKIGGLIIVGIDNGEDYRIMEYSNYLNRSATNRIKRLGFKTIKPEANEYGRFVVEEVKPFIDKTFRTKPDRLNTFIAGSSCGGNISIYLGFKYQDVFSGIGAFSPAYYIVKKGLYDFLDQISIKEDIKIYHDMGTKENNAFSKIYYNEQKVFHEYITKRLKEDNVFQVIDEGATHSEEHWARRFNFFLLFIKNNKKKPLTTSILGV